MKVKAEGKESSWSMVLGLRFTVGRPKRTAGRTTQAAVPTNHNIWYDLTLNPLFVPGVGEPPTAPRVGFNQAFEQGLDHGLNEGLNRALRRGLNQALKQAVSQALP